MFVIFHFYFKISVLCFLSCLRFYVFLPSFFHVDNVDKCVNNYFKPLFGHNLFTIIFLNYVFLFIFTFSSALCVPNFAFMLSHKKPEKTPYQRFFLSIYSNFITLLQAIFNILSHFCKPFSIFYHIFAIIFIF